MSTPRELVIEYLSVQAIQAWSDWEDEVAIGCTDFLNALEDMSDKQFDGAIEHTRVIA